MKVFVGGSRRISSLAPEVKRRLDRIVEQGLEVLVGDANGADKAVQDYLRQRGHPLVTVFCSGTSWRNNRGGWPARFVEPKGASRGYAFYAAKDCAMAEEADVGFMLWDGRSVGTLMNVRRLVEKLKKAVVYVAPSKTFADVRTRDDWETLLSRCAPELRAEVERKAAMDAPAHVSARQPGLL